MLFGTILLSISLTAANAKSDVSAKVIYGEDNRHEVHEDTRPVMQEVAYSTAALMSKSDLSDQGDYYQLPTETLEASARVCSDEPYANQMNPAFCSGFLVGDQLVATAGHCVKSSTCANTRFVFDLRMQADGSQPEKIQKSSVYSCMTIVAREETGSQDYALVRLDRPVTDRRPLSLRRSGTLSQGDSLVVIGHPMGLPTKIADGAKVRKWDSSGRYFVANLDTYGGNSGSAVINERTLEVEGILVRGETDLKWAGSCYRSNICTDAGCRGEDVSGIADIVRALN